MKYFSITLLILVATLGTASAANARVCAISQPVSVKETLNGRVLGQLKTATPVMISSYNADASGRIWAYISWQGQPLAAVKRQGLENQGWVVRDAIICSD